MNHVIFLSILLSLDCELEEKSGQFYYLFIYSVGKVRQQKKTSPYLSPHWETCGGCVSVGVVDTTNDDIARTLWRTVKWRHFTKIEKKNNQNSPKSPKSLSRVFCGQQARKKAKQQQQEEKKQKNNLNDDDDQPFPVGFFCLRWMKEDWRYLHSLGIVSVSVYLHAEHSRQNAYLFRFFTYFTLSPTLSSSQTKP